MATIGVLHPGEMGAGVGGVLRSNGHRVLYASEGRSEETVMRAMRAGLLDVKSVEALRDADVIVSICPPHAALDVAHQLAGFTGLYIDANAISPETADAVCGIVTADGARFVDGGIVGSPPEAAGRTVLYLSGEHADEAAPLFRAENLVVTVIDGAPTAASALKMSFASWTKGSSALILASRSLARAYGVEDELIEAWGGESGALVQQVRSSARSAVTKGWRWVAEMEEIAATYRDAGLPDGFHIGAAEVYRRSPFDAGAQADDKTVDTVITAIVDAGSTED